MPVPRGLIKRTRRVQALLHPGFRLPASPPLNHPLHSRTPVQPIRSRKAVDTSGGTHSNGLRDQLGALL